MKIFIVHIILISLFVIGCTTSDSAMKEGHDEMMKSEDNKMMESDAKMVKSDDAKMMKSDDDMMKSEDNMMKESEDETMKSEDNMMKSEDNMMESDDKMMKSDDDKMMKSEDNMMKSEDEMMKSGSDQGKFAKATFAGGCFWCMEPPFDKLEGVISTTSGYTGGQKENPTYEEVSAGGTGHAESVQVVYDPTKVSYEDLLNVFWKNIDPTVKDQQFCDHGNQYRTAIFYHSDEQKQLAEASKEKVAERFDNVYTEIVPASTFYPAEEYHQDYYQKNPLRYKFYRTTCGRDSRLEKLWGK